MSDELNDDLREAALLEPMPRGPGRPAGAKNKSTSRTEIRRRVQLHRQRKREAAEVEEEKNAEYENLLKRQREQNLIFFGEVAPGQNAQTAQEELEVASDFAAAMSMKPIQTGQTIRAYVNSVLRRWCEIGTPLLYRETKSFAGPIKPPDPKQFDDMVKIANAYQFPNNCDQPVKQGAV
jgi:hypothetical protein